MRKMQRQQADEFLDLLGQAHDELKDMLEKKEWEQAKSLLADCQEGAIGLGTLIESTEGKGGETVSLIEEYCEKLYQFYEELSRGFVADGEKVRRTLNHCLTRVENSVKHDIPVKREIVFLPYKASMWDSMESVWRAMTEDETCDVYVIPIPYYDKNQDGSLGTMHYEGDQYPEDVPVTDYREYDFVKRRPDVIFIHNPYDHCNVVTSVHPFFYAKKIKQFTDRLIYIPYFILNEIDPCNKRKVENIAHFCTVPGVFYADEVIVQSENMRQIYIDVLTDALGEKSRPVWEKKIWGLGSPKVDKILECKKENLCLPEDWRDKICRPDGSYKKVIFYNTGINAFLKHHEKMLAKVCRVLEVFKENRDNITLLWRPHPLIATTISATWPELAENYQDIVEQYKRENWGIYDDSADLDRALTLCDAYYGDRSSVVQLCRQVGKPVLIQNPNVL